MFEGPRFLDEFQLKFEKTATDMSRKYARPTGWVPKSQAVLRLKCKPVSSRAAATYIRNSHIVSAKMGSSIKKLKII
jgi:hypothetical protein